MTTNFEQSAEPNEAISPAQTGFGGGSIFRGPNGIRAGWRLLIFLALFAAISSGINYGVRHIPALRAWQQSQVQDEMSPATLAIGEGSTVLVLLFVVWVMVVIEKRSFADYYLPPNQAFGKRFWQGVPYGVVMLSLLMVMIAALHGFSLQGTSMNAAAAVKFGLLYGIGFICVGMFEEFSFRGYLQSTLGSGVGFWPAAIALSILFGAIHLGNQGEALFGAAMAGSFGLLAAFSLSRTGNIWFPIGMHAGWDWGETYLYGVADSGFKAQGHLLNSTFHGPTWLTGGSVGPEGSLLAFAALAIGAIGIHFLFPKTVIGRAS